MKIFLSVLAFAIPILVAYFGYISIKNKCYKVFEIIGYIVSFIYCVLIIRHFKETTTTIYMLIVMIILSLFYVGNKSKNLSFLDEGRWKMLCLIFAHFLLIYLIVLNLPKLINCTSNFLTEKNYLKILAESNADIYCIYFVLTIVIFLVISCTLGKVLNVIAEKLVNHFDNKVLLYFCENIDFNVIIVKTYIVIIIFYLLAFSFAESCTVQNDGFVKFISNEFMGNIIGPRTQNISDMMKILNVLLVLIGFSEKLLYSSGNNCKNNKIKKLRYNKYKSKNKGEK